ncbi:hypothetical protein EBT25_13430 [bacterium]|nr:hypothetical protein [bacterium]
MKKLFFLMLLLPLPAMAGPAFKYQTNCYLESKGQIEQEDVCTVVETREKGGALKSRNIYSNKWGLTIKSRFDKEKGFVTWDSHNNFEYKWEYKIGSVGDQGARTYVMPGILLENVSWD